MYANWAAATALCCAAAPPGTRPGRASRITFCPPAARLHPQGEEAAESPHAQSQSRRRHGYFGHAHPGRRAPGRHDQPARPWFRLSLDDAEQAKSRSGQAWLDEVASRMRVVFQRSNFYNAMHTLYAELGAFGTAFAFELADPRWGFRFVPLCAGEYALDCNARGRVDTVFRRSSMSLRQMAEAFGARALPEGLRETARRNPDERHTVIQAVYPRATRNPALITAEHMPVASVHWLEGARAANMPCASRLCRLSRFRAALGCGRGDVYSRSPAMDALPDCRMLQQMGITTLKAIHKAVDPPMSVAAGLKSVGLDLTPGGINYVDNLPGQSPQAATPLLQIKPDLATAPAGHGGRAESDPGPGLYNDLFKLILEGRSKVTASEIAAREEEKLVLIGPVLERLHDELFIPLIDRHLCPDARAGHAAALPAGIGRTPSQGGIRLFAGPGSEAGGRERRGSIPGPDPSKPLPPGPRLWTA